MFGNLTFAESLVDSGYAVVSFFGITSKSLGPLGFTPGLFVESLCWAVVSARLC